MVNKCLTIFTLLVLSMNFCSDYTVPEEVVADMTEISDQGFRLDIPYQNNSSESRAFELKVCDTPYSQVCANMNNYSDSLTLSSKKQEVRRYFYEVGVGDTDIGWSVKVSLDDVTKTRTGEDEIYVSEDQEKCIPLFFIAISINGTVTIGDISNDIPEESRPCNDL